MRPALLTLLVAARLAAADDPVLTVTVRDLALAQRTDYVLGDGAHPFVDEDNRKALLGFDAHGGGALALLGFADVRVAEAVADTGEALDATVPADSGILPDHERRTDPTVALFAVGLPIGRRAYAGLARLRGTVELTYSTADPERWEVPLSALRSGEELAIGGHQELTVALLDPTDASSAPALRLSPQARSAFVDVDLHDAAGKPIALAGKRPERREARPDRRRQRAKDGKDDVLPLPAAVGDDAVLGIRYLPRIDRRTVQFTVEHFAFGVPIAGRDEVRRDPPKGADDL